ncbi:hypothetical protein Baya_7899 [Bagarius yarrelli]|uniref:DUF4657 domain-containing protein n=1 Tax=Bagarius yarrelli TaxID=175774 RepID=A0A556U2N1_BAGYA|nr:hypothetical protein Baya_7899 [Bagarius yarrelli]
MNLYRSFGCLLETWVADGYPPERSSSVEALKKKFEPNSSESASPNFLRLTGAALRSESEDSGVELPSMVSPLTSQHRVLTLQVSQLEEDDFRPSSSSPALSQCSSSSSFFSVRESSKAFKGVVKLPEPCGLKVEEALRRTEPSWRSNVDGNIRRRCNTTSISSSSFIPSIRSRLGSIGQGQPNAQLADKQRSSAMPNRTHIPQEPAVSNKEPQAASCVTGPEWKQLPAGFLYLEQMCRMLEEIARLQKENQQLQQVIKSSQDKTPETETETKKVHIDSTDGKKIDLQDTEAHPGIFSEAFRRRSVSDTLTFLNQRSKSKALRAEHFPSTGVLLEEPEISHQPVKTEQRKTGSGLKHKISSLKWNDKPKEIKSGSR